MKRMIARLLAAMLILACAAPSAASGEKLRVVTTIFPIYDWVREIAGADGENAEITLLLENGVDLHSYQPTVQNIVTLSTSDILIYVGGPSDEWVKEALAGRMNPDMKAINLIEAMGDAVKEEEIVKGMEHEHDHESHEETDGEDGRGEPDEHVWLSLRNARELVGVIADAMSEADAAHADSYQANAAAYSDRLAELDARGTEAVRTSAYRTVLFGDRFPFRYLMDDYGLTYYAAFSGCSAETEASFATIAFLAGKLDELGLPAVLTIENSPRGLAETIIANTAGRNQKILTLNSMQGITAADVTAGATYLGIMEENIAVLREALN